MNDSGDSTDVRGLPEFGEGSKFVVPVVLERGEGDVDSDLISEFEAIGYGPRGIGDANGNFVDTMGFDAVTGGGFGDVHDRQARIFDFRSVAVRGKSEPGFSGNLCCHFMEG